MSFCYIQIVSKFHSKVENRGLKTIKHKQLQAIVQKSFIVKILILLSEDNLLHNQQFL